jgi:hypothetical protein
MKRPRIPVIEVKIMNLRRSLFVSLSLILSAAAQAQSVRTWVSGDGVDNSQCSRSSPCRTFAAALAAVNPNGEVVVLDSAGYGPVAIDKAVTILAPAGLHAAIAPTTGNAITINSGITGKVILRGLYLNSQGASIGISHLGNNDLFLESCVVNGFTDDGVLFNSGTTPGFFVVDSTMRNNGDAGIAWLGSSPGRGVIEDCRLEGNGFYGLRVGGGGNFTVRNTIAARNGQTGFLLSADGAALEIIDSAAAHNGNAGFLAFSNGTSNVNMHLEHCLASRNGYGIYAGGQSGTGTVRVSNCVITNNSAGVFVDAGGSIQSRGNNTVEQNFENNTFIATYSAK